VAGIAGIAFCEECQTYRHVIIEDWGNGPYEFWGATGTDYSYVPVCVTCGKEITGRVDYDDNNWED